MVVLSPAAPALLVPGMSLHAATVAPAGARTTHGMGHNRAQLPLRTRDQLRRACARSWHVPGVSRKRLARALRVDESNVSRRWGGESPKSHLSEATIEALELNIAGVSSAFMEARLRIAAAYPPLLPLSIPELQELLRSRVLQEMSVDAHADLRQAEILAGATGDVLPLRDAADAHASALIEICAICEVLHAKREEEA